MARSLWICPRRAGPAAEERQGDDQEGPDDKTDENKKEGARTGEGAGRVGTMFFFPPFLFHFPLSLRRVMCAAAPDGPKWAARGAMWRMGGWGSG